MSGMKHQEQVLGWTWPIVLSDTPEQQIILNFFLHRKPHSAWCWSTSAQMITLWLESFPAPSCVCLDRWAWQKRSWSQEILTNHLLLCLILYLIPTLVWVYPSHPFILGMMRLISEGANTGKKREKQVPKLHSLGYNESGHTCLHLLFQISSGTNELTHFLLWETTELSTSLKRPPKYQVRI